MRLEIRRWSLRSFLFAITLVCVLLAYYVSFVAPQRVAIGAIKAAGGYVLYGSQVDSRGQPIPDAKPWNPVFGFVGNDWFNRVVYVSWRYRPYECDPQRNSSDMARYAGRFPHLHTAVLFHCDISTVDLQHFVGLDDLRSLFLFRTDLGAGDLKALEGLKLTRLAVDATKINDEGAISISHIASLEDLSLSDTYLSNSGLQHLQALPNLKSLDIRWTFVTENAYREFQRSHPTCTVKWQAGPPTSRAP